MLSVDFLYKATTAGTDFPTSVDSFVQNIAEAYSKSISQY